MALGLKLRKVIFSQQAGGGGGEGLSTSTWGEESWDFRLQSDEIKIVCKGFPVVLPVYECQKVPLLVKCKRSSAE